MPKSLKYSNCCVETYTKFCNKCKKETKFLFKTEKEYVCENCGFIDK